MGIKKCKINFIIFLFCFIILNLYLSISIIKANEINNEVVRLHIISNSNNVEDQIIKLKVTEIVEKYISNLKLQNLDSDEILNKLSIKKEELLNIINDYLSQENVNYNSSIAIGKIYYDEKKENQLYTMNEGYYNSIKITLGKGKGKNFWNFISPNKKNLEKLKEYETILPGINKLNSNESNTDESFIVYKSRILEFLKNN